jgi:hypothetical protein
MEPDTDAANVRETFTEYDEDGTKIAVIQDPENGLAWIESTVSRPIEP